MAVGSPPTMRRRQLGRELRRLREESGLLAEDLAERLRCSASRVSRIESARIRIGPGTVHEILDVLDIGGAERSRLVKLARQAEEPGWWLEYGDNLSYEYATYISLESEASSLKTFEPIVVYGLLQTEGYARAVIESGVGPMPEDKVEALVAVRMRRQKVLQKKGAPKLHTVLDESVLHRVVGSPGIMQAQLRHLVEIAQRPNVRLQLLPFESGTVAAYFSGPVVVIQFADPQDKPVVYLETMSPGLVDRSHDVQQYESIHDRLAVAALSPERSIEKINAIISGASA